MFNVLIDGTRVFINALNYIIIQQTSYRLLNHLPHFYYSRNIFSPTFQLDFLPSGIKPITYIGSACNGATVLENSSTGNDSSISTRGMDVCPFVFASLNILCSYKDALRWTGPPRSPRKCLKMLNVVGLLCIVLLLVCASLFTHVYCFTMCVSLICRMLARSQYPEGPTTGHLSTGFS